MANVRFWSISREEWEAGSYHICKNCGTRIRHIVEIDGHPYGADCAGRLLRWPMNARKATSRVETIGAALRYMKRALELHRAGELSGSRAEAIRRKSVVYAGDVLRLAQLSRDLYRLDGWELVEAVLKAAAAL